MTTWTGYVSEQPFAVSQKAKGAAMANGLNVKQEIPERSVHAVGKRDFNPTSMILWGIFTIPIFWWLFYGYLRAFSYYGGDSTWLAVIVVWSIVYWLVPLIIYFIKAKESTFQVTIQRRSAGSFVTIIAEGISGNAALGMLVMGLNTNVRATRSSAVEGAPSNKSDLTAIYSGGQY